MENISPCSPALHSAETRLAATWAGARDGLWDWDLENGAVRYSPRWKELLGYAEGEIPDRPEEWFRRVHPQDIDAFKRALAELAGGAGRIELELRMIHRGGSWRWVLCRGARASGASHVGGSLTDVTALKLSENRLLVETMHDRLTGLPNESLFLDRLALALVRSSRRPAHSVAVLYLDLDRFHTVNDSCGVVAGDELLVEIARRLTGELRLGDTLGRLGGDKFALLLDGVRGAEGAVEHAREIARTLKQPLSLGGHEVFAQGSMGIALARSAADRPEDLLRDAITAMHRAKRDGTSVCEVFDPVMNVQAKERLKLEADLHHALRRGEFVLHYQPIVSLAEGGLSAFEALVRWQHPERGLVRPDLFIPIAEETGLIVPLGSWVLEEACRAMRRLHERFPDCAHVSVAVNLSGRQFEDKELVASVAAALERTTLAPNRLELEMTESVVMAPTHHNAERLHSLRDLGIRLLIDDFGTGYSSLSSLQSFPLDSLKIDRTFVSRMEFDADKREIVRTILSLARTLEMGVVAEGIETAEQLAMLRELGCEHGQGFFFSNALDERAAASWMENPPSWG
ncbi:MAG: GGDEF and EAL domain-containing protein [Planctomycetes bacterium]|nr:GGDEF and EAL domain-containing protein [Planctomycetota bacterium]